MKETITAKEFILTNEELILMLNIIEHKTGILGLDLPECTSNAIAFKELENNPTLIKLIHTGYVEKTKQNQFGLHPKIRPFFETLSKCNAGLIVIRWIKNLGFQRFYYSIMKNTIVERTEPEDQFQRLYLFNDNDEFFQKIRKIIPIESIDKSNRFIFEVSEDTISEIVDKSKVENVEADLQKIGLPDSWLPVFQNALENPDFTVSIIGILIQDQTIIDTVSAAIFANKHSSWGIWPKDNKTSPDKLLLFPSDSDDIILTITHWLSLDDSNN